VAFFFDSAAPVFFLFIIVIVIVFLEYCYCYYGIILLPESLVVLIFHMRKAETFSSGRNKIVFSFLPSN
jgi:hypothetical protein